MPMKPMTAPTMRPLMSAESVSVVKVVKESDPSPVVPEESLCSKPVILVLSCSVFLAWFYYSKVIFSFKYESCCFKV